MKQIQAKILYNKKTGHRHFHMSLLAPYIARHAKAGQFVQIRCGDGHGPLLRRPFGVHSVSPQSLVHSPQSFEILYEVVGKATEILSCKKPGEYLDILGPLGNGFSCYGPSTMDHGQILVAGGIGVAPLLFLAQKLPTTKHRPPTTVLIGAKTKSHLLCEKDFKQLGCDVKVATDDGTKGHKGKVTDLLKEYLLNTKYGKRYTVNGTRNSIYACGPTAMLREAARIAGIHQIPCQVSMHEHMACGIGVCMGCAVKVKSQKSGTFEYKRACKDGPVFNTEEIIWD